MYIALAILALGLLVAFHELGHLWVAKRAGMRVERYSLGFGPVLFSRRRGDTEYVLAALPLGGYVRIAGLSPDDGSDPDDPRGFANQPAWKRLLVIGAGPAANYLLAYLLGVPLLMFAASEPTTQLAEVRAGRPAAVAGLAPGDVVRSVAGREVASWDAMRREIAERAKAAPDTPVAIGIERRGGRMEVKVVPERSGDGFVIGIAPETRPIAGLGLLAACGQAAENIWKFNVFMVTSVSDMLRGRARAELGGPVAIVMDVSAQAKKGLVYLLTSLWGLTVAVGFFNLLPLPGLDGGRLLFLGFEAVSRRKVNQRVETWLNTAGVLAVLALILVVTWGDIMGLVRGR